MPPRGSLQEGEGEDPSSLGSCLQEEEEEATLSLGDCLQKGEGEGPLSLVGFLQEREASTGRRRAMSAGEAGRSKGRSEA